ncbi:MAG: sugar ABC transporter permease [Chloroflexi bacterium]|nr:sugar ABC transporter permease [Chloroflexota bacterium]
MAGWSGRRKTLTILLFLLPTILAVLVFNVYPLILNTYISFTNRNRFRPNPDCTAGLNGVLDPLCWPVFSSGAPKGLGNPYKLQEPILKNYETLIGRLFTTESLLALLRILLALAPLVVVSQVNRRFDRGLTRPVSSGVVWLIAIVAVVVIGLLADFFGAVNVLMTSGDFIVVVFRTILFVVFRVPLTFLLALTLALILNDTSLKGNTFFRTILFLPWGASSVAILVSLIWQFIFREQGVLNQLLAAAFGIKGPVWLNDPASAFGVIVLADIYFSFPFFMIAILGAMQSIPADQYEAAEVDGASWWQQLTNITLPLIRPAVLPATVLTSITAFQMFGTAFAITAGGPQTGASTPGATEFVMIYAYRQIFQLQNYGNATAFAVIIFIMLFAVTLWSLRITRITKGVYE